MSTANHDQATDAVVLDLLLHSQQLWAVEEVVREIGNRLDTLDSLDRLAATGLVHRVNDGFVMASRAARYGQQISFSSGQSQDMSAESPRSGGP